MLTRLAAGTLRPALGAALVAALVVVPSASAPASADGCVTRTEFNAVAHRWTPQRVAGAFGTAGKRVSVASFSEIRRYAKCHGAGSVVVNYERPAAGRPLGLVSKYW